MQEDRKLDHIELAQKAQTAKSEVDSRFFYEPMLAAHPQNNFDLSMTFLDKNLKAPLWVSSMTGGVGPARHINQNLARLCAEFGLGMGLGSCRSLLDDNKYFKDFNLRPILGNELPFYANLGIAQIEQLLLKNNANKISDLLESLQVDGLIVHVNPLQEWFQSEGDRLLFSPLETIEKLCSILKINIIVKEVGQGMGPASLKALLGLPITAIELGAFGGTNFSVLEQLRNKDTALNNTSMTSLSKVGHTALEMIDMLNLLKSEVPLGHTKQIIISGGVKDMLEGFHLHQRLKFISVIGQAKNFLIYAENYEELKKFVIKELSVLKMAFSYLKLKEKGMPL